MPTYGPDGSIELDTTVHASTGAGTTGGPGTGSTSLGYRDSWFQDEVEELEGLQADRGYEYYRPGFQYGWEAAGRYRGRGWPDASGEVEREWRSANTGRADRDWEDYRHAIRHAFERAMKTFEG